MRLSEHHPSEALRPLIRAYYHVRMDGGSELRFPSDCCPGMILCLGRPFELGARAGYLDELGGCRLFGYLSRELVVRTNADTEVIAVKVRPGQLMSLTDMPGVELTDTSVPVEEIWGRAGSELLGRTLDASSPREVVQLLDAHLERQLGHSAPADRRMLFALEHIMQSRGRIRIDQLAGLVNLSRRQLERRFTHAIGLPPKRMCRITRIGSVLRQLDLASRNDWIDIALEHGYSDQAHLIREWRYFTGASPTTYLRSLSALHSTIVGLGQEPSRR